MSKLPSCPYCGEVIQSNQPKKAYKGHHYHSFCYSKMCEEIYNQSQSNQTSEQRLYQYICQLFKIEELTPFLAAQLKRFEKEYAMTYDGMWFSLKYYFEVLDNKIDDKRGIGIIPYVYDEAKNFYKKLIKLQEVNAQIKPTSDINVRVGTGKKRQKKQIDISNL